MRLPHLNLLVNGTAHHVGVLRNAYVRGYTSEELHQGDGAKVGVGSHAPSTHMEHGLNPYLSIFSSLS